MENKQLFSDVKVGDELIFWSNRKHKILSKVEHVTNTRFQIEGKTFTKDGLEYGRSSYCFCYVSIPTEKDKEVLKKERAERIKKKTYMELIEKTRFNDLENNKLKRIYEIIKG